MKRVFKVICQLSAALLLAGIGRAQPVTAIAAGYDDSLFIRSGGSLWAMGQNDDGQLGDGTYNNTNLPVLIAASNITAIATGYHHSLYVSNSGSLWATGYDFYGELGDGVFGIPPLYTTNQPERVISSNITAVSVGFIHSLLISNNASLWAMGDNSEGELGDGDNTYAAVDCPRRIVSGGVTKIAAGYNFSLFLGTNGGLWAMGVNYDGQLGAGNINYTNFPTPIATSNIIAIAAGDDHSLFISNNGSLWGMGLNSSGQLGTNVFYPTNPPVEIVSSNVTAIAAGSAHTLFLETDGSLWGMGDNASSQLGNNFYYATNQPVEIESGGVIAIAAGGNHSMFIKSDGSLWVMGENQAGELGDGTENPAYFPEQVQGPAGYDRIIAQLLSSGDVRLSYVGVAGTSYALDRAFNLQPAVWVPQSTNPAAAGGLLVVTNAPELATNNFWRIRSVPPTDP